ncbi:MAG: ORF6N domain-containing protein [Bacteroidota bacterium]
MNTLMVADESVMNKIYSVRKQRIMLDKDLAALYGVQPIRLRERVKRNMKRFPANFMFQLTGREAARMVSQNAIPSKKHLGGFLPYAFTEHGVLMLAAVLRSDKAMQASIRIIEIFVKMRDMLTEEQNILAQMQKAGERLTAHDEDIQQIFEYLKQLLNPPDTPGMPRSRIGFRRKDEKD